MAESHDPFVRVASLPDQSMFLFHVSVYHITIGTNVTILDEPVGSCLFIILGDFLAFVFCIRPLPVIALDLTLS